MNPKKENGKETKEGGNTRQHTHKTQYKTKNNKTTIIIIH